MTNAKREFGSVSGRQDELIRSGTDFYANLFLWPRDFAERYVKHQLWINNEEGGERLIIHSGKLPMNLSNLNLRKASLSGANMQGANLMFTNMTETELIGTNLRDANLTAVDLRGAIKLNTILTGANLTNVSGLKTSDRGTVIENRHS